MFFSRTNKIVMKSISYLGLVAVSILFSCGPKEDLVKCQADSVNNLDGIIYNGHVTLCNAQGPGLYMYETGLCSLTVKSDTIIFLVFSTNPDFHYYYSDTLAYECVVFEGLSRTFKLFDFTNNDSMGAIYDTENDIHLIINDNQCPESSFFEGDD